MTPRSTSFSSGKSWLFLESTFRLYPGISGRPLGSAEVVVITDGTLQSPNDPRFIFPADHGEDAAQALESYGAFDNAGSHVPGFRVPAAAVIKNLTQSGQALSRPSRSNGGTQTYFPSLVAIIGGIPGVLQTVDRDVFDAITSNSTASDKSGVWLIDREGLERSMDSLFEGAVLADGIQYVPESTRHAATPHAGAEFGLS